MDPFVIGALTGAAIVVAIIALVAIFVRGGVPVYIVNWPPRPVEPAAPESAWTTSTTTTTTTEPAEEAAEVRAPANWPMQCPACAHPINVNNTRAVDDGTGKARFEAHCPSCHVAVALSEEAIRDLQRRSV